MDYRYNATTIGGFIQQLAVCYIGRGYWFYVQGAIPKHKEPKEIDEKLLAKYQIPASKFQRCRRKRWGVANLQYLRFENSFLILATHGIHAFFKEEAKRVKDVRRETIYFEGYSVSYQNGHPKVSLAQGTYEELKAHFLELAVHRQADYIAREVRKLPFESYAPVRRQLVYILTSVNKRRKAAGLPLVPYQCIRFRRTIYQPFAPSPAPVEDNPWAKRGKKQRSRKRG